MSKSELGDSLARAVAKLAEAIGRDPEFRAGLRAAAEIVMAATAGPPSAEPRPVAPPAPPAEPTPPIPVRGREPMATAAPMVRPSDPPPGMAMAASRRPGVDDDEDDVSLETIAARCRVKADGARWAVERKRRLDRGADFAAEVAPGDREIVDRARQLPDCFLWMNQPHAAVVAANAGAAEDLAQGYETTALAAEMLDRLLNATPRDQGLMEPALLLAAEAQSALRISVERLGGRKDSDQVAMYLRLRDIGAERRIYVNRFMKLDDPASPSGLPALRERIADMVARIGGPAGPGARDDPRRRVSRLGQLRYHAKLIRESQDPAYHAKRVAEAVDHLISVEGFAPGHPEIRDALLPVLGDLPDPRDGHPGLDQVLRELDRHRDRPAPPSSPSSAASRPAPAPPTADEDEPGETAEVARVRRLLAGRSVIFIGGTPRTAPSESLRSAFGLKALDWLDSRDHPTIESLEPDIARPDVAVVLLASRWSSHSFDDVNASCQRYGKPLVRLTVGYNPATVASQILAQVGDRLESPAEARA